VQDSYAHCEALVRDADKDRFLATLFAPAERRPHLFALYAFNLEIARVGQVVHEPLAGEIRLQWWRDALSGERGGETGAHPVAAALLDTIARCNLPLAPLLDLVDARSADLYEEPMTAPADLETYGRRTASGLFVLAARILDRNADVGAAAGPAGIAWALTGVLKAFPVHAAHGRLYLPLDLLARAGATREDILARKASPGLAAVLAEVRAVARGRLDEASQAARCISPRAMPAFLIMALVAPLLTRLEQVKDPFMPVELAPWRRPWLLWRAARRGRFS
jgi:phytoene synthase